MANGIVIYYSRSGNTKQRTESKRTIPVGSMEKR